METPRPEIRYHRLEDEEEGEVTVWVPSQPPPLDPRQLRGEACARIVSSLLLLTLAAGFVFYNLPDGSAEQPITQQRFLGGADTKLSVNEEAGEGQDHHHDHQEEEEPGEDQDHHHDHHHEDHQEEEEGEDGAPPGHAHSPGTYHHAAAVTDSETCSTLAQDILRSGGSVVDAGIVAVLCLAVVHPHTSSLGGIFSSIFLEGSSQKASVLNAIPDEASSIQYGIPQVLQGLWLLHQKHGRTPWSQLVGSATILAEKGFLVDAGLGEALEAHRSLVLSSAGLCDLFCKSDGSLLGVGERVRNLALGRTLGQISSATLDSGLPDDLMQSLVKDIEINEQDKFSSLISRSKPAMETPLSFHLGGLTLYTTGGPTAGQILATSIGEIYNQAREESLDHTSEVLLNASKLMYARGGAWPTELSTNRPSSHLLSQSPAPVSSSVLIANSQGDLFMLSLTLNSIFGSRHVSASTGILLSDFVQGGGSTQSSTLRYWACPSVVLSQEENSVMGLVASGGSSVPFSLAQVITSHLLLEKDLSESVHGSLVEASPESSDPWMGYFGLQGRRSNSVVAVEVEAEHVHVGKSQGPCCYPAGL